MQNNFLLEQLKNAIIEKNVAQMKTLLQNLPKNFDLSTPYRNKNTVLFLATRAPINVSFEVLDALIQKSHNFQMSDLEHGVLNLWTHTLANTHNEHGSMFNLFKKLYDTTYKTPDKNAEFLINNLQITGYENRDKIIDFILEKPINFFYEKIQPDKYIANNA